MQLPLHEFRRGSGSNQIFSLGNHRSKLRVIASPTYKFKLSIGLNNDPNVKVLV